jgi:hypothetical protein
MNDILCWANHPLLGNVMGITTSQNPDTTEGLESRLFIRTHRIPVEHLHSTKLELKKLRRTQIDSSIASVLELLHGLLKRREVLRPSEPLLSLYSTRMNLGTLYRDKPHFLHTFCQEEYMGIYGGIKSLPWLKLGLRRPTC